MSRAVRSAELAAGPDPDHVLPRYHAPMKRGRAPAHIHSTSERFAQEFEELKMRLGMDGYR